MKRECGRHMAELSDSNSLELRIAFHNAVSRFQDWTADVAEPKVRLCGRFWPISEVCQEIADLSNPLPEFILSVLYKQTKADDDALALKLDKTIVRPLGTSCALLRGGKTNSAVEGIKITATQS